MELDWKEEEGTAPAQVGHSCNETSCTLLPLLHISSCSLIVVEGLGKIRLVTMISFLRYFLCLVMFV